MASEIVDLHLPEAGVAHNYTIVKIKSVYEGQALKIMNSLWGSGQMSLNKCLFITDKNIEITNYKKFAKESLINFNPETDIYYTKGPMDVLDHAAEKFTIGSKIGFDFTIENTPIKSIKKDNSLNFEDLKNDSKNIKQINSLLNIEIPILIISINKKENIYKFSEQIIEKFNFSQYKIIIFIDDDFDAKDLYNVAWIVGNNIAPKRDTYVVKSQIFENTTLIVDATKKTKEFDDFDREWPEITVMNNNNNIIQI